jgi:hypothetical protein
MSFIGVNELLRSIEHECRDNDKGGPCFPLVHVSVPVAHHFFSPTDYYGEYKYVVLETAHEQREIDSATKKVRVKDKGNEGMKLDDFTKNLQKHCSKIRKAHVAVLRMYTGKLYRPWNGALRNLIDANNNIDAKDDPAKKELLKWATCISVLYEALIMLSFETKKDLTVWRYVASVCRIETNARFLYACAFVSRIYSGVNESHGMTLHSDFTSKGDSGFAGGVEVAFMSTTCDPQIAVDFSGAPDKKGSIFEIKFTAASRGVDVQMVSLWPEEKELLYAPLTYLTCQATEIVGQKKLIKLDATMSTARPNLGVLNLDDCRAVPQQPCEMCRTRAGDKTGDRLAAVKREGDALHRLLQANKEEELELHLQQQRGGFARHSSRADI